MGYYSKVAVILWKPDYNELEEKYKEKIKQPLYNTFDEIKEFSTPDETYVLLFTDDIKWYENDENYKDIRLVMDFIKNIRHSYVRIGADKGDVVVDNKSWDNRGSDEEFEYFIDTDAHITGLEVFGVDRPKVYGYTFITSDGDAIREFSPGKKYYGESITKLFSSIMERDNAVYEDYVEDWCSYVGDNTSDDYGNKMLSKEEFNAYVKETGQAVIQLPEYHITYELFDQEVA